jgi:hypothetical protein
MCVVQLLGLRASYGGALHGLEYRCVQAAAALTTTCRIAYDIVWFLESGTYSNRSSSSSSSIWRSSLLCCDSDAMCLI